MRAQIVKLSNSGEEIVEEKGVLDEEWAMRLFEDYILNDPGMDDYVKEEYAAFACGEDENGREKRIGWLVKNGKISETSVTGKYSLYLYIIDEDEREVDEYDYDNLVHEGFGKLIGTAAKGLWRAMKPALKEVAKDVAKDIAKDAAKAGIKMAMTGIGKLNKALISKIRGVSPATADVIESAGMIFLQSCSENNVTEESLTQYANQFIEKAIDGADKKDMEVLGEMRKELENTKDSEEKIAKVGNMVAVAKQTSTEEKQEMRQAAESRKRR